MCRPTHLARPHQSMEGWQRGSAPGLGHSSSLGISVGHVRIRGLGDVK